MVSPVPPVFVAEGDDLGVFCSVEEAELSLEAVDVQENTFTAYDAEGRLLSLSVRENPVPFPWCLLRGRVLHVVMTVAEEEPGHIGELRALLGRFLKRLYGNTTESFEELRLDELVQQVVKAHGLNHHRARW